MNVGITIPIPTYSVDPAFTARRAEELGFESIWCGEHPVIPVGAKSRFPYLADGLIPDAYGHFADPFVVLGRASAVTTTIKLGTGVVLLPERNPLLLAKQVATLDLFSGGRLLFGIGAGWLREETEIMGGDFDQRWAQTRESVLAMKELWTRDEAEFHGRHYDFPPVRCLPKPAQRPHPPIIIGGIGRRTLRRVAEWADGWLPTQATPDQVSRGRAILDSLAAEVGRDPASITISVHDQPPDRDLVETFFKIGVERVVIRQATFNPNAVSTEKEMSAQLERIAAAVFK